MWRVSKTPSSDPFPFCLWWSKLYIQQTCAHRLIRMYSVNLKHTLADEQFMPALSSLPDYICTYIPRTRQQWIFTNNRVDRYLCITGPQSRTPWTSPIAKEPQRTLTEMTVINAPSGALRNRQYLSNSDPFAVVIVILSKFWHYIYRNINANWLTSINTPNQEQIVLSRVHRDHTENIFLLDLYNVTNWK